MKVLTLCLGRIDNSFVRTFKITLCVTNSGNLLCYNVQRHLVQPEVFHWLRAHALFDAFCISQSIRHHFKRSVDTIIASAWTLQKLVHKNIWFQSKRINEYKTKHSYALWLFRGAKEGDFTYSACRSQTTKLVSGVLPVAELSGQDIYIFSYFFDRAQDAGLIGIYNGLIFIKHLRWRTMKSKISFSSLSVSSFDYLNSLCRLIQQLTIIIN